MDKVGISQRAALGMFWEAGFNDPIGMDNAINAINNLPRPCEILTNKAKVPANYAPCDRSRLDKLIALYVIADVRYWGYL